MFIYIFVSLYNSAIRDTRIDVDDCIFISRYFFLPLATTEHISVLWTPDSTIIETDIRWNAVNPTKCSQVRGKCTENSNWHKCLSARRLQPACFPYGQTYCTVLICLLFYWFSMLVNYIGRDFDVTYCQEKIITCFMLSFISLSFLFVI